MHAVTRHPLAGALLIGGPIAAAYAILANVADLGGALTGALYLLVVAVPVVLAAELDADRRGASTRLSRLRHRRSHRSTAADA